MGMTKETYFGDGLKVVSSGNHAINIADGRNFSVVMTSAGLSVNMPDEDLFIHTGGVMFMLHNIGTNEVEVQYDDSTPIGNLPINSVGRLWLSEGDGTGRVWYMKISSILMPDPGDGDPPDPPGGGVTSGDPGTDIGTGPTGLF